MKRYKKKRESFFSLKECNENRKPKVSSTKDFSEEEDEPKNVFNFLGLGRHSKPKKWIPAPKQTMKIEKNFYKKIGAFLIKNN